MQTSAMGRDESQKVQYPVCKEDVAQQQNSAIQSLPLWWAMHELLYCHGEEWRLLSHDES
jgi:hypothetical protein